MHEFQHAPLKGLNGVRQLEAVGPLEGSVQQVLVVEEGVATRNVNISDWYAPAGTFPLPELAEAPVETPETLEATPQSG